VIHPKHGPPCHPTGRPILLLGAHGQVGRALAPRLTALGNVVALGRADADMSRPESLRAVVRATEPWLVVHAAAYTAVDAAEQDEATCLRVNAEAPAVLAEESARLGAPIIHYSTNYVFDGHLERPYREDDEPTPQGVYGRSKLLGEAATAANPAHLILRLAAVYASTGRNFVLRILDLGREREELRVVEDQLVAPTPASAVADASVGIVGGLLDGTNGLRSGVYHLTCSGSTSWYGFAERILALDPRREEQRVQRLVPVSSNEFAAAAPRPLNGLLDCGRAARELGVTLPDWESELERVMASLAN
jgi:dTDP-4-dehydrorhamnose reductase